MLYEAYLLIRPLRMQLAWNLVLLKYSALSLSVLELSVER